MLMTLANSISAPLGGWLSDRSNPAYTITVSVAVSTLAMLTMSRLGAGSSVVAVGFGLVIVGMGMGLFQSSSANLIMGSVPHDRLGMGGGIMGLARGMGTVSSVAIMGAVFSARDRERGVRDAGGRFHPRFPGYLPGGGCAGRCRRSDVLRAVAADSRPVEGPHALTGSARNGAAPIVQPIGADHQ